MGDKAVGLARVNGRSRVHGNGQRAQGQCADDAMSSSNGVVVTSTG